MSKGTRLVCVLLHTHNIVVPFHALLAGLCRSQGLSRMWINKGERTLLGTCKWWRKLAVFYKPLTCRSRNLHGRIDVFNPDEPTQVFVLAMERTKTR